MRAPLSLSETDANALSLARYRMFDIVSIFLFSLSNGCSTTRGVKIQSAGLRFMARPLDAFEIDDEGEGGDLLSAI